VFLQMRKLFHLHCWVGAEKFTSSAALLLKLATCFVCKFIVKWIANIMEAHRFVVHIFMQTALEAFEICNSSDSFYQSDMLQTHAHSGTLWKSWSRGKILSLKRNWVKCLDRETTRYATLSFITVATEALLIIFVNK